MSWKVVTLTHKAARGSNTMLGRPACMPLGAVQKGPWVLQQCWVEPAFMSLLTCLASTSQTMHSCGTRHLPMTERQLQIVLTATCFLNQVCFGGLRQVLLTGISTLVPQCCRKLWLLGVVLCMRCVGACMALHQLWKLSLLLTAASPRCRHCTSLPLPARTVVHLMSMDDRTAELC